MRPFLTKGSNHAALGTYSRQWFTAIISPCYLLARFRFLFHPDAAKSLIDSSSFGNSVQFTLTPFSFYCTVLAFLLFWSSRIWNFCSVDRAVRLMVKWLSALFLWTVNKLNSVCVFTYLNSVWTLTSVFIVMAKVLIFCENHLPPAPPSFTHPLLPAAEVWRLYSLPSPSLPPLISPTVCSLCTVTGAAAKIKAFSLPGAPQANGRCGNSL